MMIYDQLSRSNKKVNARGKVIKMYVCGPTVYDEPHLGHIKTYITFDVLAKYLRQKGYTVFYLQNITDIDDKIINRAEEIGVNALDLSKIFLRKYMNAMKYAKIDSVNFYAPATDHIREIIRQIRVLEGRNFTYRLPDGVYYRVWMDSNYGVLSGQKAEKLISGKRASVSDMKEDPRDFVLWKFKKKDSEPSWSSPWGEGRPGWHIEDTAIASKYFGNHYDLHGAGKDLIFPHHESELSIMSSLKGNTHVVDIWIYSGILKIKGEKMSKSENNFIPVSYLTDKYSPETIRMCFLSNNYGSETDFSDSLLEEARKNVDYISKAYQILHSASGKGSKIAVRNLFQIIEKEMDNDINTRNAIAGLIEVCSMIYKTKDNIDEDDAKYLISEIDKINSYLGIINIKEKEFSTNTIEKLIDLRDKLRKDKLYDESDIIRGALKESGIVIEDNHGKSGWHYEN